MTFKELKEIINRLPERLDDSEVYLTKIKKNGIGDAFPLDKVVYGQEVILWSNYHEEEDNGKCIEDNTPHTESTVLFKTENEK